MKARVKATGKTIDVEQFAEGVYVSTYDEDVYLEESLDFWGNASSNLDYWTRLEHTYAGMAMQGLVTRGEVLGSSVQEIARDIAEISCEVAHALVEKMKEERK